MNNDLVPCPTTAEPTTTPALTTTPTPAATTTPVVTTTPAATTASTSTCGSCQPPVGWVSDEGCSPRHLQGICVAGFCTGSEGGYQFSCQKNGCQTGLTCFCDGCKCKKHSIAFPSQKHFKDCGAITTTKSTTTKASTTTKVTPKPTPPTCSECCPINGGDPSSCGPKDTKKFAKCADGVCKFSNGTHDVQCHSSTCDLNRKRWRSNGMACDCDCACSAKVSNSKKKWRDCGSSGQSGSCGKKSNLIDPNDEDVTPSDSGSDDEGETSDQGGEQSSSGVPKRAFDLQADAAIIDAPPLAPAEVPLSTPHHHHKHKTDDDDDDDEDRHNTCRNGRHEHGEQCDGPSDDTLFMICSEHCKLEVFWPPIIALILLAAVIVCCCCFFITRCVRLRAGRPAKTYRKALACDLHNTVDCPICKAAKGKTPLQVTVVKSQLSSSSSSSSSSDSKKPKKK